MTATYTEVITFAGLVDEAVQRAKDAAHPFTPSRAQYEAALDWVCLMCHDCADPWAFIKATHRGAGTMDAIASEMFKRGRA